MSTDTEPAFWTAKEFAELYDLNYKTLLEELARGQIPGGFRVGWRWRIDRETFRSSIRNRDAQTT